MISRIVVVILCAAFLTSMGPIRAFADTDNADIQKQITELREKLADLEKKLEESQKAQEANAPTVTAGVKGSKVKIDARMFVGLFETGADGSPKIPNWSTDIRDAKIRFTFNPSKNITVVNRLSTTGAKNGDFDYFYLDYVGALGPTHTVRIGQRKVDVGQEIWVDNPVENMLITNAAPSISGYATGIALLGRFQDTKTSPLYEVGFVNGAKGTMVRPTNNLPINIKLGLPLPNNLFASLSYFTTGDIRWSDTDTKLQDRSAISIAGITGAPAGATEWNRKLWELDLRYNYGSNGIRPLIPTGDIPKVMLGATYGSFGDDAVGAPDRDGKYWFVEGLFRLDEKLYGATRYSVVDLDSGVLDKLAGSPVAVNSYRRTSIGLGYALTESTHLKTEYTINNTSGGASDPSLNQFAVGIASKF